MLPSSHRLLQKDFDHLDKVKIGDIKRYYKTPLNSGDATDAGDKSKIDKNKLNINIPEISRKNKPVLEKFVKQDFNDFSSSLAENYDPNQSFMENSLQSRGYKYNMKYVKYPFSDKHSPYLTRDLDEIYTMNSDPNVNELIVELCIYHINLCAYKPFLEFMLYKCADDNTFYFPNFTQNLSDYNILENASMLLNGLFGDKKIAFKGRLIESKYMNHIKTANIHNRVILVYEVYEVYSKHNHNDEDGINNYTEDNLIERFKNNQHFHWATVFEIFNIRKLLFYDISDTVIDVFLAYTQIVKLYYNDSLLETPMVVFFGSDKNTIKYISVFSIKKANNESRYGPFYYFTDLHTSMKYACYDIETHEKYEKGGIVRFVIYPGKIKMFLKKDKRDRSLMAKHIMDKYSIEKYTAQFRDNDCNWTEKYNSAYNGSYIIDINEKNMTQRDNVYDDNDYDDNDYDNSEDNDFIHKYSVSSDDDDDDEDKHQQSHSQHHEHIYHLGMRICIRDYRFQMPLSYYYINTDNIPNKYEYDFKNYKII